MSQQLKNILGFYKQPSILIGLCVFLVIILTAILQDFLSSRIQHTGFYISESLLYNCLWIFLLPFGWLEWHYFDRLLPENGVRRILLVIPAGLGFSLIHMLVFTSFFVGVSSLVFSPAHNFGRIFRNVLSNQFFLIFLFYIGLPFARKYLSELQTKTKVLKRHFVKKIKIKIAGKSSWVEVKKIQAIITDRPYTLILFKEAKHLTDHTLKHFETLLNPVHFIRVHRSAIVNLKYIKTLESRQNGDYDALLKNGQSIRLSRHFKKNWEKLLH